MEENIVVRQSNKNDLKDFYQLWRTCFDDSVSFCDWLFENRFFPEYSTILENNNEIVSCMQGVPYVINIRNRKINGVMLCGVSTNHNHRKKGFMNRMFTYSMNQLKEKNVSIAVHTPAVLESYFKLQHLPVAKAVYVESKNLFHKTNLLFEELTFLRENSDEIFNIYTKEISEKYSGAIYRNNHDFFRKWANYKSDDGKCLAMFMENKIVGYGFFYVTKEELICVEAVTSVDLYEDLVQGIMDYSKDLLCKIKLPPKVILKNYSVIEKEKGVAGCISLSNLLKSLNLSNGDNEHIAFKITDKVVPNNNGIFTLKGEKINSIAPAFEMEIGSFMQVLIGYKTLEELENNITIYNKSEYYKLNKLLSLCDCYIIDEY